MNVRIHQPLRTSLTACLGAGGLALAVGCGASATSKTTTSSYGGPVPVAATDFRPFPVPTVWTGASNVDYTPIQKAVTGTKPHKFIVQVHTHLVFWLSCIGTGTARLSGPAIKLNWSVPCGTGEDPAGLTIQPARAALGGKVKVIVAVPAGDRWEVRIDAPRTKKKPAAAPTAAAPTATATPAATPTPAQ